MKRYKPAGVMKNLFLILALLGPCLTSAQELGWCTQPGRRDAFLKVSKDDFWHVTVMAIYNYKNGNAVCESERKNQYTCVGLWHLTRRKDEVGLAQVLRITLNFDLATQSWSAIHTPYFDQPASEFSCGKLEGLGQVE